VTWLGPGHCRACNARLFVYRTTDGLRVWVQPNLVNACPSCGISMTTTTVALTTEDDPEAGS
jgi:5-methylcytosine-specific restriction endonuclease McrA